MECIIRIVLINKLLCNLNSSIIINDNINCLINSFAAVPRAIPLDVLFLITLTSKKIIIRISVSQKLPKIGLFQNTELYQERRTNCEPNKEYNFDEEVNNMINNIYHEQIGCTFLNMNMKDKQDDYALCKNSSFYRFANSFAF